MLETFTAFFRLCIFSSRSLCSLLIAACFLSQCGQLFKCLQSFSITLSFACRSTPKTFLTRSFKNSWSSTFPQNGFLAISFFASCVIFIAEVLWVDASDLYNRKIVSLVVANFSNALLFSSSSLGKTTKSKVLILLWHFQLLTKYSGNRYLWLLMWTNYTFSFQSSLGCRYFGERSIYEQAGVKQTICSQFSSSFELARYNKTLTWLASRETVSFISPWLQCSLGFASGNIEGLEQTKLALYLWGQILSAYCSLLPWSSQ